VKCRAAGGIAESAAPNTRCTSASLIVVTGPGVRADIAVTESRGLAKSADPAWFDTPAAPVTRVSESGNNTTSVCAVGRGTVATGL
jgi:hypothetical protein